MNLDSVFYPKSIALIGASTKPQSVGNDILKNLIEQGYKGEIYPVNPSAPEILGKKSYSSVLEVDGEVELVIVAVPAKFVPQVLRESGEKGAKSAIVISAGFKEMGNLDLEKEIVDICKQYDISLIGPNCLGVIAPEIGMNASFASIMPKFGNIAFLSQSGAICTAILDYAPKLGIGFSKFVSLGNKALVDEAELLEYLYNDKNTRVIGLYIEELPNPKAFLEVAQRISTSANPKPIIVLKSGRTTEGASASASHTGALAGSDKGYQSLFDQAGVIRANTIAEFFNYLNIFANAKLPKGDRVAIITNAGGPGVLTADAVIENGLKLATISQTTIDKLTPNLPPASNLHNPIDILGDAKEDRYKFSLETVVLDENVDSIIVLMTPQSMTEPVITAKSIIDISKKTDKTIIAVYMGQEQLQEGLHILEENNIPHTHFPEEAVLSLSKMINPNTNLTKEQLEVKSFVIDQKSEIQLILENYQKNNYLAIPEFEAVNILEKYGFDTLKYKIAKTEEEAYQITEQIGVPVVMKIVSEDILHKSDVGGVVLNITKDNARESYNRILDNVAKNVPKARIQGILIVEMANLKEGSEFIVGCSTDPSLGHLLMVGYGGIFVEVFKDIAFGIPPLRLVDIENMIDSLKSKAILEGVRGQSPLSKELLIDTLGRMSQLLIDFPMIEELDINPLLVTPNSVKVLDARITLKKI